jgi:MFS family permease
VGPAAALSFRDFRLFQLGKLLSTLATQIQGVAVGWQVYELTGSPFDLGYVGLAQFAPALAMSLLAGHVADRFDRRRVLVLCHAVLALCAGLLCASTFGAGASSVHGIYAVLVLVGTARAFQGPASSALMPNLIPAEHFANALAWSSSTWQLSIIAGPALGGLLYPLGGARGVYLLTLCFQLIAVASYLPIKTRGAPRSPVARGRGELLAGLRYITSKPVILGAISLDLFAVLFGGAVALLPVYAKDILHIGPQGLGALRSAPAVGAFIVAVILAHRPIRRQAGAAMFVCVALFGLATIVFGVSRSWVISLLALAVTGAADMVSVFVRQHLVQLGTPDAMRGRVAAVNSVFVGASNELGEFESGVLAGAMGVVPAVVAGGVATCVVVAVWAVLFPALRKVDGFEAHHSPQDEQEAEASVPRERSAQTAPG